MANKILIARGTKARIETIKGTLETNEVVYATDTGELGVKKADGNIEYFMNATDINASKQDKLVAGDNITIDPTTNVISASGGIPDVPDNDFYLRSSNLWYRLVHSSFDVIDINSGSAIRALMNSNEALMYTNLDTTNYKLLKVFGATGWELGIFAQLVDLTTGEEYQMANVQMVVGDTADPIWVKIEDTYNKTEIDLMLGDIESALDAILGV